jgi:(S)-ureidoglycine aminohydrolase
MSRPAGHIPPGIIPPGIIGSNRTMVTPHYAVMPPEGILESRLPGLEKTRIRFQTSPAMGAAFAQALLEIAPGGGTTAPLRDGLQHFFYILEGAVELSADGETRQAGPGDFCYVPAGGTYSIRTTGAEARAIWIKKPYQAAPGIAPRGAFFGQRDAVPKVNKHTAGRSWQALLGEADLSMDMEINILSFAPGTYFPFVETHIMEHGLYMLEGQGLYLLGRDWHECWSGDFVWMGPYVPQQFYATGWGETAYLLYKNVNRDVTFHPTQG